MYSTPVSITDVGASADYHVSGTTSFALGHYPEDPIYPGVMSLRLMQGVAEAMASHATGEKANAATLKRVSYLKMIRPGDVLRIECDRPKHSAATGRHNVKARVLVGEEIAAKSEFTFNCETGAADVQG
ncbi:MAG: hypothetical protein AAFQ51_10380 [Pseudomonadota bacterium]